MKLLTILITFFSCSLCAQISEHALRVFEKQESAGIIIQLKEQNTFRDVPEKWTKENKTRYVHTRLKETANKHQQRIINYLQSSNTNYRSYYLVNAIFANLNKQQATEIASMPEVAKLIYDAHTNILVPSRDVSNDLSQRAPEITWGILRVGADKVWNKGYKGKGVVVGGNDTGVQWDIPAIKDRYRGFENNVVDHNYNWHDGVHMNSPLSGPDDNPCGLSIRFPCDDNSHGTHTVGTMVGLTDEHAIGMAPEAQWIGCRNMERGNGSPSTYIECFEFFLAPTDLDGLHPKPELAPHVVNNSWYCSLSEGCDTSVFPIMEIAVDNLKAAGIVVVVSAGNDGAFCGSLNQVPALYENSFTVGAFEMNETISDFSCNGPVTNYEEIKTKPNVVAPGSDVLSMLPDGSYASWSGTSMAGPHVAGLVALMISANPLIAGHVEQIETIIEETAERFTADFDCFPFSGSSIPNNTFGFGLINADAAVERALIAVSSEDVDDSGISIYPNPVADHFQLLSNMKSPYEIQIRDICGKIISYHKVDSASQRIECGHLAPGLYFIVNPANASTLVLNKI